MSQTFPTKSDGTFQKNESVAGVGISSYDSVLIIIIIILVISTTTVTFESLLSISVLVLVLFHENITG